MNYRHSIVVVVATVAVIYVCLFPPYYTDGGLIGGSFYVLFSNPPPLDYQTSLDMGLVQLELAFIVISVCSALFALRTNATRRQRFTFLIGFIMEVLFCSGCLPSINTILAPQLTWHTLNLSATVIFAVVLVIAAIDRSEPSA